MSHDLRGLAGLTEDEPEYNPEAELAKLGVSIEEIPEEDLIPDSLTNPEKDEYLVQPFNLFACPVPSKAINQTITITANDSALGLAAAPVVSTGNPKDLLGVKKPSVTTIPPASILYQAMGMMDGVRKYGLFNWRDNPVKMRIYLDAAVRHIMQILDGEDFDPVSGAPHIGHALACLGILADATETGNLIDDRPSPGPAGEMIRHFEQNQTLQGR